MPGNILFSGAGKVDLVTVADYAAKLRSPLEVRNGTVIGDPLFVDLKGGDYRFLPDSPARTLGIEPLDVRSAGPR